MVFMVLALASALTPSHSPKTSAEISARGAVISVDRHVHASLLRQEMADDGGFIDGLELSWQDNPGWQADLDKFVLNATKMPVMVVSTRHEVCMVDSFISHAEKAALDSPILHAGMDQESHAHCADRSIKMTSAKLHCLDLSGWIPDIEGGPSGISNDNAGFNGVIFNKVAFSRVVLLKHAVQTAPHGVLLMDADVVLHGDLPEFVSKIRSPGVQFMAALEYSPDHPNLGLVWADRSSMDLLNRWLSVLKIQGQLNGGKLDQDLLYKTEGFRQSAQLIDHAVVGQCATRGTLATHYNCVASKIASMKADGVWKPVADICQPTFGTQFVTNLFLFTNDFINMFKSKATTALPTTVSQTK